MSNKSTLVAYGQNKQEIKLLERCSLWRKFQGIILWIGGLDFFFFFLSESLKNIYCTKRVIKTLNLGITINVLDGKEFERDVYQIYKTKMQMG